MSYYGCTGSKRHRWQAVLYDGRWVEYCRNGCGTTRRARIDKHGKPVAL